MLKQGGGTMKNKGLEITLDSLAAEVRELTSPPTDQGRILSLAEACKLFGMNSNAFNHWRTKYRAATNKDLRSWRQGKCKMMCEVDLVEFAKWLKGAK